MGRGWGKQVTGVKAGTCPEEHWVIYGTEPLYSIPELGITLHMNCTGIKENFIKKGRKSTPTGKASLC